MGYVTRFKLKNSDKYFNEELHLKVEQHLLNENEVLMKKERKKHILEIEKYQKMLDKAFLDKDIDSINDISTKLKLIEKKIVSVDTNYSNFDSYK